MPYPGPQWVRNTIRHVGVAVRYRSADRMLHAYAELYTQLSSARALRLPDPREAQGITTSGPSPGNDHTSRSLAALADIAQCLRDAKLDRHEWLVLKLIYQPRRRHCQRCHKTFGPDDLPRCPECGAGRKQGWTFEPYPTLAVLGDQLRKHLGERRVYPTRVGRLRDRAIRRIETAMAKRGMLDDSPTDYLSATR